MDINILVNLLAKRIPANQFQLWGLEVHWMSEEYNTPENRAIVEDVISNYATLEATYLAEKEAEEQAEAARIAAKTQALIDNLPSRAQVHTAITNIANLADAKAFLLKLTDVVYWLAKDKEE